MSTPGLLHRYYPELVLTLLSCVFCLFLVPEARVVWDVNDSSLHQVVVRHIAERLTSGENFLDFVVPEWACGFPLLNHYQFLPQLLLALVSIPFSCIPLNQLYHIFLLVILLVSPWSLFYALKRFGLTRQQALCGACLSLFVLSSTGFGHEFTSYLVIGIGLFTQAFAMLIFPWALVLGREVIQGRNKHWLFPWLTWILLGLSHYFLFYAAVLILFTWLIFTLKSVSFEPVGRVLFFLFIVGLSLSFLYLPHVLNAEYHSFSRYEPLGKINSYGMTGFFTSFVTGDIFDADRFPIITILVILGLVVCLLPRQFNSYLVLGFGLSCLLYFGRTTWGPLYDWLPMGRDLHAERFIVAIQFFGVILAGIGLSWIVDQVQNTRNLKIQLPTGALLCVVLVFLVIPTFSYLKSNADVARSLAEKYDEEHKQVEALFDQVKTDRPGRIFAGRRSGWGNQFTMAGVPVYFLATYHHLPMLGHLAFGWSLAGDFSEVINEHSPDHLSLFNISHILSWRDDQYWNRPPRFVKGNKAVYHNPGSSWFQLVATPTTLIADKYSYWHMTMLWLQQLLPDSRSFLRIDFDERNRDNYLRVIDMVDPLHYRLEQWTGNERQTSDHALFEPMNLFPQLPPDTILGQIVKQELTTNGARADVSAQQPCVLLFKQTFHPFWKVVINNQPVKPIMVSPGFLAVDVPAGRSHVEFYYQPPLYKRFLLLVLPIVFLCLVLWGKRKPDESIQKSGYGGLVTFAVIVVLLLVVSAVVSGDDGDLVTIKPEAGSAYFQSSEDVVSNISIRGFVFSTWLKTKLEGEKSKEMSWTVPADTSEFETWFGIPDTGDSCPTGQARFEILVDGEVRFASPVMAPGSLPVYARIAITPGTRLTLRTTPIQSKDCVNVCWVEGKFF